MKLVEKTESHIDKNTALRMIKQCDRSTEFSNKELEIRQKIMDFEEAHKTVDKSTGKCEFGTMQEYVDLQIELKKLQHEAIKIGLKDQIAQAEMGKKGYMEIIRNIERNIKPKGGK